MTVESTFKEWVVFMSERGPMGRPDRHLSTDQFKLLRDKIKEELKKLDEDDENFFMGGGMS